MAKGIDTNVLVRYLTMDDSGQSKIAATFIEEECSADSPAIINTVVLCELVWVLRRAYGFAKEDVIPVLKQILATDCLDVDDCDAVWGALREYQSGKADFSDYLLGQINRRRHGVITRTFDLKAAENHNFILLK